MMSWEGYETQIIVFTVVTSLFTLSYKSYNNQPDDDSPQSKHVAMNINSIVVVLKDDIL